MVIIKGFPSWGLFRKFESADKGMLNMRCLIFSVILISGSAFSAPNLCAKCRVPINAPTAEQRGTDEKPFTVKLQPDPSASEEARKEDQYRQDKAIEDRTLTSETTYLAIGTGFLAFFTFLLFIATYCLARDAKESGKTNAKKMEDSIKEAARAATAMQSVATHTENNAKIMQEVMHKQMRAYIAVNSGIGIYQDPNNRFAGNPVIINTGYTPARNVHYSINAGALNIENILLQDLVIPAAGEVVANDIGIAPRQEFVIFGIVKEQFPTEEIIEIMKGDKKRLFVWGTITYDDVYGGHWSTKFCINYTFFTGADNSVKFRAYHHCTHNEAT